MNIGKIYFSLAVFVVLFCITTFVVFSIPSFQWPGVDSLIWPIAIGLLGISAFASLFPALPYGRRAIGSYSSKGSFTIGYVILVCYTVLGVVSTLLYYLRATSGV
jgi:hypothetical protein